MQRIRLSSAAGPDIDVTVTAPEGELASAHFDHADSGGGGDASDPKAAGTPATPAAPALPAPVSFTHAAIASMTGDGGAGGVLTIDGRPVRYRAVRTGERLDLWVDGRVHHFTLVSRTARRSGHSDAGAARAELVAPMPGTILRIVVREGDAFEAGAPLIVMESMKMEMTITSPVAGRVGSILCSEGELVRIDQVLLKRLDAEPA